MQSRKIQKKANNFIKTLNTKSTKEVEQAYLDNKEFENNEIVRKWLIIIFGIWGLGLLSLGMYRLIVFIKDEVSNYFKK
jgi:hypothetical protein